MRIYYVANARIPTEKAHGIQIMKMCGAFSEHKADVNLIVPTRHNPSFKNTDPFDYFGVDRAFKLKKLWTPDPWWLIGLPGSVYIRLQAIFFLTVLFFYFSRQRPERGDVCYTRDEHLLPFLQRLFKKVVWEGHNLPRSKKHFLKYWQNCGAIVVITKGLKDDLVELGVEAGKILVAPDGVDLEQFGAKISKQEARSELGLPQDKNIVMYTGHLYGWKGADVLLGAAKELRSPIANRQSLFVFVGGTPSDIQKFKEKAKGAANVLVLGHKPQGRMPKYLAAADVLVLPNSAKSRISRRYTSPMKLFEYMASGRPIVASSLPSIQEVLNQNNSVLVRSDDLSALSEGIGRVLGNPDLADTISKQAYEDVKQYDWNARAKNILRFINA